MSNSGGGEGGPGNHNSGFHLRNPALFELPQNVACSDKSLRDHILEAECSCASLEAKLLYLRERGLLPFLTGSALSSPIRLLIELEQDLSSMKIFRIDSEMPIETLNGDLAVSQDDLTELGEIPAPRLIFSAKAIMRGAKLGQAEGIFQLFNYGKRITRYLGVPVSWDQSVDENVWTTNIDTVCFLRALLEDGVFEGGELRRAVEVGVGGGAISKTLVAKLPGLEEITVTDINPFALMCARRNISPILRGQQRLNLYLGKGIRNIAEAADILVINPPYVPTIEPPDTMDPYRGTGLIKEILEIGLDKLNPENPSACIYMGMSNLAMPDLERYLNANPRVQVETVGEALQVPLKILAVNENRKWLDFLIDRCGLLFSARLQEETGFGFWHELSVLKLSPKNT